VDAAGVGLIAEGVKLMVIGMSTVFAFLALLVGALFAMSSLAARLEAKTQTLDERAPPGFGAAAPDDAKDPRRIAVIAAAIVVHRSRRPR
jgi:oxaloacetate decarboxylase gamma subunit